MRLWKYLCAFALSFNVVAQDASEPASATQGDYLIARQGKSEVWAIDVDAHLASMPKNQRAAFIDSPKRIQQLLSQLLLRRNLAIEARENGLDKDPIVQRELLQAAEVVLMRHRLDQLLEITEVPDLEPLAKEKFQANRDAFRSKDKVTVAHILLDTKKRTEAEAIAQLEKWKSDVTTGKATIEELAKANSDDPGVSNNNGVYADYDVDSFVPAFAEAVRNLEKPGDLSEPVKTEYGVHLIQLRDRKLGQPYTWEELKDRLVEAERAAFLQKKRADYVEKLKALPVEASEASVAPLRDRYGSVPVAKAPGHTTTEAKVEAAPKAKAESAKP